MVAGVAGMRREMVKGTLRAWEVVKATVMVAGAAAATAGIALGMASVVEMASAVEGIEVMAAEAVEMTATTCDELAADRGSPVAGWACARPRPEEWPSSAMPPH